MPQLDRFAVKLNDALSANHHDERFVGHYFPAHQMAFAGRRWMTTGLAVLVRTTCEVDAAAHTEITHVRVAGTERFKQRRIAAKLRIRPRSGAPFDFVNTHLSLPAFFEVGPHRVPHRMGFGSNQVAEVDNLLDWIDHDPNEPLVLVGDFNSMPGSPAYARLTAAGLVDAYAAGRDPVEVEATQTAAFLHLRMHIDHVFSTPAVRWREVRAHPVDGGPFGGLSDHAPKEGTLQV